MGDEWHKISYNNRIGYIFAAYVDVQLLSTDQDTSTDEETSNTVQTGTVTTDNLKVRTGAGTSYSILGTLKKGASIEIVEVGASWHRIKYGTGYGYVSADYVKLNTSSDSNTSTESKNAAIQFENDLIIELGSDVDLLKDVTVVNVGDQGYILDVRQSTLDLTQPGTYQVEYVAKYGENFANELTKVRTVIVQDTQGPKLTLKGSSVITLKIGETYKEPGISVVDNSGELIKYSISGNQFDTSVAGVYKITYTAKDSAGNTSSITREVRVQDPNAPILTLEGETYMVLRGGEAYIEPGYKAVDGNGNPLKVAVIGAHFDHLKEGQYTIEYIAKNADGIKAVATRVVVVKDVPGDESEESPFIGTGKPTLDHLNVRSGRGTSYKALGKLNTSDVVNVYDLEDHWYRIEFNGGEGYVHEEYLEFTKGSETSSPTNPDADLPITPDTEGTPLPEIETTPTPDLTPDPESDSSSELELPTVDKESLLTNDSILTYLIIGFGVCISAVLGISGLLLFNHFKAKKVSQDPAIQRPSVQEVEDEDDSSFPRYY